MKFLTVLLSLVLVISMVKCDEMYFDGSGDDTTGTEFPTDDEDIEEASGFDFVDPSTTGKEEKVEIEVIDTEIDSEPEVNGGKTRNVIVGIEETEERIDEEVPEEEETDKDIDLEDEVEEPGDNEEIKDGSFAGSTHFIAAVVVGGCIGLLFAVCVIMLLVYRMRKKDEGSYALEYGLDGKKPQGNYEYTKGVDSKEYYA